MRHPNRRYTIVDWKIYGKGLLSNSESSISIQIFTIQVARDNRPAPRSEPPSTHQRSQLRALAHFFSRPRPMSNTTEQNFRSNLSQFRWSRGNNDDSQHSESTPANNPFSRFYNAIASGGGYVPLRSSDRSNEEEAYFALSRWDRCVPATLDIL